MNGDALGMGVLGPSLTVLHCVCWGTGTVVDDMRLSVPKEVAGA